MNIYSIDNKKYNVNFDLKLDSFFYFIEELKESKKYYHDYCNLENINTKDFDNEYIDTINILKSDLLKYYILITDNNDIEKYVIINDTIKDIYNSVMKIFTNMHRFNETHVHVSYKMIISSFNINYLTRKKLDILIKFYAYVYFKFRNYNEDLLQRIINIDQVKVRDQVEVLNYNPDAIKNLNNYLDSLNYKTIYERELDKILNNLPNICLSHISSKKLLNNNNINPIKLDNNKKFIEVD